MSFCTSVKRTCISVKRTCISVKSPCLSVEGTGRGKPYKTTLRQQPSFGYWRNSIFLCRCWHEQCSCLLLFVERFGRHNKPCHEVNKHAREGGGDGGKGVNEANQRGIPIEIHGNATTNACYLAVFRTVYSFVCIHVGNVLFII